jgi:hypothetical protein
MFDLLPPELVDMLPPGRFLPDGVYGATTTWQSDEPVADPLGLWEQCERAAAVTGVWPVLSGLRGGRYLRPQWSLKPADVSAVDLESELEATWRALRARQAEGFDPGGFPEDFPDVEETIESMRYEWEHRWPPYTEWPGLAPAGPERGTAATEVHRRVLASLLREAGGAPGSAHLALIRAERPADVPAVMAWEAEAPNVFLSAMLRSWEDRFRAQVVGFEGSTMYVSVARPPGTASDASQVALEHMLLGDDNHRPGLLDFADYAESLVGERCWSFWWD